VLFVNLWDQTGAKRTLEGHDYYYLHDETLAETDDLGPLLRLLRFVKFGRWTSNAKMNAARQRATEDA
jgi:hypothetical protein